MKFIIKIILLFFVISTHVNAINFYKYPEESLDKNLCNNIYDKLNNPNFPYSSEEPITVNADLLIEDVHHQAGDNWLCFDDDIVTSVKTEEILALRGGGDWHTAYLCIYRKLETNKA